MTTSLRKILRDMLDDSQSPAISSDVDIEALARRIEELHAENNTLKKLYLKAHEDIGSLQTIVKTIAVNQAQIVSDFHAVYSAIRATGILDVEDDDSESVSDIIQKSSKPDSGGSHGGMGGMIN
jgi:hypothetical protein